MQRVKLLLSVIGATALLGTLVTTASANSLANSSETTREVFENVAFSGGFGTTECSVTLEGTLHSKTFTKTAGALIGYLTGATLRHEQCRRGSATILTTSLPWHVRYESFTGVLPNIRGAVATVSGVEFQIGEPFFGLTCLAGNATVGSVYGRNTTNGEIAEVTVEGEVETNCGVPGRLLGTTRNITERGGRRITVTLI